MTRPYESVMSMRNWFLFLQNDICADQTAHHSSLTSNKKLCQETVVIAVYVIYVVIYEKRMCISTSTLTESFQCL